MAIDRKRDPTELELHRAAAWWAGEGSVSGKNRKLVATFCQKEEIVCHWFLDIFGGSVTARKANKLGGPISVWIVCGDRARYFLSAIVHLIPESPRRQSQILHALKETDGRLKTGPMPKNICFRGHPKTLGENCKECGKIWSQTAIKKRRSAPDLLEAHRRRERERYQNNPEYAAKKRAYQLARNKVKKGNFSEFNN
jgi:hypothetical protein